MLKGELKLIGAATQGLREFFSVTRWVQEEGEF